jgi:hypothetical protein
MKIIIDESEHNFHVVDCVETNKEEIMKKLHLTLFNENKIEEKIFTDLRAQKITKRLLSSDYFML